jgi:hypothetical protein
MHHHPEAHGGRLRGGWWRIVVTPHISLTESRGGVHWLFL